MIFAVHSLRPKLFGCVLVLCVAALAGCSRKPAGVSAEGTRRSGMPTTLVVPSHGAYTGAYIDFGDAEDNVTLESIEDFEQQVGKHQAIIAFSSFWGEGHFPAVQANIVTAHQSIPLIFWSPWDYPYREDLVQLKGPDKFRLDTILAGQWDAYIDQWADAAKAVRTPFFVSLCNEMNGDWFPWSASFYGGKNVITGTNPPQYAGPEFFKRAYRYIVDRVRARGANNILWVFHVNNYSEPYEAWNDCKEFYPGPGYVDWMGLSVYGSLTPDSKWNEFEDMIDKPYEDLAALDPNKPMMVTEWGVGEFPGRGDKAAWIETGFNEMATHYPRLKAAVYWNERWQNGGNQLYSNLRVGSSPAALAAYRRGVAKPFWLDHPFYR